MNPPNQFWYLFATNGSAGFLLDLIARPGEPLARLVTYRQGQPPQIVRRGFRPADLNGVAGTLGVTLGNISLDHMGCSSAAPGIDLDASFALSGRGMRFVPAYMKWIFDTVPDFRSQYGELEKASCAGAVYEGVPVTCSTYSLDDFAAARWVLISAPRFPGSDLAFEISAARLFGRWMPSAWVFLGGREYHLNSAFDSLLRVHISRAGDVDSGARVFTASVRAGGWKLDIEASAPLDQFARLEADRKTEIHTTLFGTCKAALSSTGKTLVAQRTCLLEIKDSAVDD